MLSVVCGTVVSLKVHSPGTCECDFIGKKDPCRCI